MSYFILKSKHTVTTEFDPIEGYQLLNKIAPKYFRTTFPYNVFTADKFTFTKHLKLKKI